MEVDLGYLKLVFREGKYCINEKDGGVIRKEESDELITFVTAMDFERKAVNFKEDIILKPLFLKCCDTTVNVYDVSPYFAAKNGEIFALQIGLQENSKQKDIGLNLAKFELLKGDGGDELKKNIFASTIFHELGHCCDPKGTLDATTDTTIKLESSCYSEAEDPQKELFKIAKYQAGDPKTEAFSTLVEAYVFSKLVGESIVTNIKEKLTAACGKLDVIIPPD
jgi:hypothetical protein